MLKLMKSDFYKLLRRPYLYVLTGSLAFIVAFMNLSMTSGAVTREMAFGQMYQFLFFPLFIVAMFADITTAEEIKYGTLKNTVSFGVNRTVLYFSKLFTATILGVLSAAVILAAFLASGYLFIKPGEGFTGAFMQDFMMRMGTAVVLYIGAVSLGTMLAVLLKKSSVFGFAYAGLLLIPVMLFYILSSFCPLFSSFAKATLFMQCYSLQAMAQSQFPTAILIGVLHYLIFGLLGAYIFNRQEIN